MSITMPIPAHDILRAGVQWVCYKKDKVPYNPRTGEAAKANDPTTWATHEEALQTKRRYPQKYAGTGREFVKSERLTGIDLDHCIDEQGKLTPFAQDIVNRLNSYTEYSPSKTGLHIWIRASLLDNLNADVKHDGECRIEMYDHDRYFTVTGKHFPGTPTTIEDRQLEVLDLYKACVERRRNAREQKGHSYLQPVPSSPSGDSRYGLRALERECDEVRTTPDGSRNVQLNKSAYSLGQLIAGNELTQVTVENALYDAAVACGLPEREIISTMRGGLDAGMKEPRHAPPVQEKKPSATHNTSDSTKSIHKEIDVNGLPDIVIGAQLRDITRESLIALELVEQQNPTLFVQSTKLKRIALDKEQKPYIEEVTEATLRGTLTRAANFYRVKGHGDECVKIPVSPPKDVVQDILSLRPQDWPFPSLEAIVQTPILRPDGTILDTPGYDETTHLYYIPQHGLHLPPIPKKPTRDDVVKAVHFVQTFFQDFPYEGKADLANVLGLALTTVCRQMFTGNEHVPLALIDATKQGTGKGLMTDVINEIATGNTACAMSQVTSDEEWDKRITAMLMSGTAMITIDNVEGVLRSPILAKALTSDAHEGRVLGTSTMIKVPQRAIWIANGNNLQVGGDMARRSYRIRMITHVSNPWEREDFVYPDLHKAVHEQRGAIIAALLTIARGWFIAGKPIPSKKIKKMGTFSTWCETIGSMLFYAGIEGFLENIQELHKEADVDGIAWSLFLETWLAKLGGETYRTSEIIEKLKADADFADTLPDPLGTLFLKEDKSLSRKLGKQLSKKNNTPFGELNLRIEQGIDSHTKVATFKVAGYSKEPFRKSSTNAVFAVFADSGLTYAQDEKSAQQIKNDTRENHIEQGAKYTPQTPQTPQSRLENKKPSCNLSQDESIETQLEQVRTLVMSYSESRTYALGKPFLGSTQQVNRDTYLTLIEKALQSRYGDERAAAIAEIMWRLGDKR